jgi:hypothetical protein
MLPEVGVAVDVETEAGCWLSCANTENLISTKKTESNKYFLSGIAFVLIFIFLLL